MGKRRRKRQAWKTEDIRKLKTLAQKQIPATYIARKLKRTEGAIRQKAFSLGLSLETRAGMLVQKILGEEHSQKTAPSPDRPGTVKLPNYVELPA